MMGGVVGGWRGAEPRLNTSMMIMRPPQHGQVGALGSTAALAESACEFETASSSRARAMLSALQLLANKP